MATSSNNSVAKQAPVPQRGARRRTSRDHFLREFIENGGHLQRAAAVAGVRRETIWKWRQRSPDFAAAYREAAEAGASVLVDEAIRRGVHGVPRRKFGPDGEEYTELEYSDRLLLRLLEARHPSFGRRVDVAHSGQLTLVDALSAVRRIRDAELLDDGSPKQIEGPAENG